VLWIAIEEEVQLSSGSGWPGKTTLARAPASMTVCASISVRVCDMSAASAAPRALRRCLLGPNPSLRGRVRRRAGRIAYWPALRDSRPARRCCPLQTLVPEPALV
jgi:hypothetical protein